MEYNFWFGDVVNLIFFSPDDSIQDKKDEIEVMFKFVVVKE